MKKTSKKNETVERMRYDILVTTLIALIPILVCTYVIKLIEYEKVSICLIISSVILVLVCLSSVISEKSIEKIFYIWKDVFFNIAVFAIYLAVTLSVFRPVSKIITIVIIFAYWVVELAFVYIRVFKPTEDFKKSIKKNNHKNYYIKDSIIASILIDLIPFIAMYFDEGKYISIYSTKSFLVVIICPISTMLLGIILVHKFAQYRHCSTVQNKFSIKN